MKKTLLAASLFAIIGPFHAHAATENEELRALIEQQKKALEALEQRLEESEKHTELVAQAVEEGAASSTNTTTIGGYGEVHYNNIKDKQTDSRKEEIDFHRFVLFFGHEFSEKTRFFSEVELEHSIAGEGKDGEIELEQAYIEHDINNTLTGKAGLFLMPVGIINETHEPPTFYGTERNPIEKNIIPATWWEAGLAANIKLAPGLAMDTAVTSGLSTPLEGSNAFKPRSGRQKVSEAKADNLAYTARLKYTAIPGLELAATMQYQSDVSQGELAEAASATLFSAHVIYSIEQFTLRSLYAQWDIDGAEAAALGRDTQRGYYLEPSYRLNEQFGVFARYSRWDNTAGDSTSSAETQTSVGVNYWLHEDVVFKFDYEKQGGTADANGFNLGVGYQF